MAKVTGCPPQSFFTCGFLIVILRQWLSPGCFCPLPPPGDTGNAWRNVWFSQLGEASSGGQRCCWKPVITQDSSPQQRMSVVLRMRNCSET